MEKDKRANRYSPETRAKAVRMVLGNQGSYESQSAAIKAIAPKVGCGRVTLRRWIQQEETDLGRRDGVTSEERARIKDLEREVRELRQANEILEKASERYLGAREKSITKVKYSVGRKVFNSNGQVIDTKIMNKELRSTDAELDQLLRELLEVQGDCCAITALPLQFRGGHSDENMLPSLDRIGGGHYERDNLQRLWNISPPSNSSRNRTLW